MSDTHDSPPTTPQPRIGLLRRLLGRHDQQASAPRSCTHCGYELPQIGANPVSCPRCGQVMRFIA
ncbi:MAG TPA: hypothetical protein VH572_03450 [Gaiella sp.]|jgi:hypothetical protein